MNPSPLELTDGEWQNLVNKVSSGKCTPFVGLGAASGIFGDTAAIARALARKDVDLLANAADNLPRLAQQLQTRYGEGEPRSRWADLIRGKAPDNLDLPEAPHLALAGLNFPLWITTTYDDLIERALVKKICSPEPRLCKWSEFGSYNNGIQLPKLKKNKSGRIIEQPFADYNPPDNSPPANRGKKNPLVYHLYGHYAWEETLVTSQVDFLEFLAKTAEAKDRADADLGRISTLVKAAVNSTSLLFMGYRLGDLDFRILLHTFKDFFAGNKGFNIAIQVQPSDPASTALQEAVGQVEQRGKLRDYAQSEIKRYFPNAQIRVVFADAAKFATELRRDGGWS